MTTVVINHMYS